MIIKQKGSKTDDILRHLMRKGKITSVEAFKLYDATRLSAIIFTLRGRGYNITTEMVEKKDKYGKYIRYGVYKLIK